MNADWHLFLFLRILMRQIPLAVLLTVVLEGVAALPCGLRSLSAQGRLALVNVVTNPVAVMLFYLYYYYGPERVVGPFAVQVFLELLVVLAEWRLFRALLPEIKKPLLLALWLNVFSWGLWYLLELTVRNVQ